MPRVSKVLLQRGSSSRRSKHIDEQELVLECQATSGDRLGPPYRGAALSGSYLTAACSERVRVTQVRSPNGSARGIDM